MKDKMYRLVLYEVHGPPTGDKFLISKDYYGDDNTGKKIKAIIKEAIRELKEKK